MRLHLQRLAVVIGQSPGALLRPKVRVFYSTKLRSYLLMHDIDLSAADCGDRIAQPESAHDWGFRELEEDMAALSGGAPKLAIDPGRAPACRPMLHCTLP